MSFFLPNSLGYTSCTQILIKTEWTNKFICTNVKDLFLRICLDIFVLNNEIRKSAEQLQLSICF